MGLFALYIPCALTIAIETAFFACLKRYRSIKGFLWLVVAVNGATNLGLNMALPFVGGGLSPSSSGYLKYDVERSLYNVSGWWILLGELAVLAVEYIVYAKYIKNARKKETGRFVDSNLILSTLTANLLSFSLGLLFFGRNAFGLYDLYY